MLSFSILVYLFLKGGTGLDMGCVGCRFRCLISVCVGVPHGFTWYRLVFRLLKDLKTRLLLILMKTILSNI